MKKIFFYTAFMIVLAFVQHFLVSKLVLWHTAPDVMPLFIAFTAMSIGQRTGTSYGFAAGIISGFLSGSIGMEALIGTIEGFVAGFFHVPEESHATSTRKRRKFYMASAAALLTGNALRAIMSDPLSLPIYIRLPEALILGTLMSMIICVLAYHLALKKMLRD
ncbi:rod shape-determining protein MreD [Chlorobaculum parvum NCIB 8327]|uniref:Rod shape-determining protein MreD n=1 Tax=Chlorobaculum parvum (strain DSM 263 / NCIMB 8327) TaxID=517417 RepID=B3QM58_CHLP8|nr:rod shape-determining protein MreD [Chlorobaculum parvum]ACF11011.1 rod shape-determining protein MreD [Chlorobaculum parvum NCIB 8327]